MGLFKEVNTAELSKLRDELLMYETKLVCVTDDVSHTLPASQKLGKAVELIRKALEDLRAK